MSSPNHTPLTPTPNLNPTPNPLPPSSPHHVSTRPKELLLIISFLVIIGSVPIIQIVGELTRGERVQCTDVFRYRPTAKNLRQCERTLEDKSWFQKWVRPQMQKFWYQLLGDTGSKAVQGPHQWLFYRSDVRYLVEPDRLDEAQDGSPWVRPSDGSTRRDHVVRAIVHFRDQLKARGIELLMVPVPGKPSIYPDQLTRRFTDTANDFHSPTLQFLADLRRQRVETIDLFTLFQQRRQKSDHQTNAPALYLANDTHWTAQGAQLAAQAVARKLADLSWTSPSTNLFVTAPVRIQRYGDIFGMMQLADLNPKSRVENVDCEQVSDPALGLLIPVKSERPGVYKYPAQKSNILVLGDSFCRIYQMPEPITLGELPASQAAVAPAMKQQDQGLKRLLPGSAGFISQLSLALKAPVDAIVSDGGASTDVRKRLSTNPEILEGKKVVIWEFIERDIALGREGWEDVPLPPQLDTRP